MPPHVAPDDPRPVRTTRIVNYGGVLEQALRDLAAWVEKGAAPPASTKLPGDRRPGVRARRGVGAPGRPTDRRRDRRTAAHAPTSPWVRRSTSPQWSKRRRAPGTVVSAEWDFDGSGEFAVTSSVLDGSCTPPPRHRRAHVRRTGHLLPRAPRAHAAAHATCASRTPASRTSDGSGSSWSRPWVAGDRRRQPSWPPVSLPTPSRPRSRARSSPSRSRRRCRRRCSGSPPRCTTPRRC